MVFVTALQCSASALPCYACRLAGAAARPSGATSPRARPFVRVSANRDLGSTVIGEGSVDAATAWQRVEELRSRLARVPELPKWRGHSPVSDTGLLWWFLRDRRLDVTEAKNKLVQFLHWRRDYKVERLGPELFAREMRTKKGYVHRHTDVAGRPVLVAIAKRHNVLERKLEDSCRMCAWMLETALGQLATAEPPPLTGSRGADEAESSAPERRAATDQAPEQALGIFDLRGFSPLQADLEVAAFLVDVLYNYYPARTGRVLLVGAPELFRSFWENIRPLLGRYASLADFVTAEDVRRLYFEPGREPPEFREGIPAAAMGGSRAGAGRRSPTPSPHLAPWGAFAGATLLAAAGGLALRHPRRRAFGPQARRISSVGLAAVSDLGGTEIGGGAVDPATAWRLIDQLRHRLEKLPALPMWRGKPAAQNDGLLWWFLRDRHFDVGESVSKLEQCLRWRKDFRVDYLGPEHFMREMRTKKAYFHKHRDVAGRPVLVIIAQRHNLFERRLDESCSMCAWYLEQTMERLATADPPARPPEGYGAQSEVSEAHLVEQALGIIDLRGFSPVQADMEFVSFLVQAIHSYYPGRFGRILLVDAPDVFRSFWENVRPLLHRYSSLADFVSAKEVSEKYFAPGEAPPEFQ